jgi:hypothetical protein
VKPEPGGRGRRWAIAGQHPTRSYKCSIRVAGVAWVCWWRVILTWQSGQYSPTGAPEQVLDVTRPGSCAGWCWPHPAIHASATTGTGCIGSGTTRTRRGTAHADTS